MSSLALMSWMDLRGSMGRLLPRTLCPAVFGLPSAAPGRAFHLQGLALHLAFNWLIANSNLVYEKLGLV